jgi:hypothetical protein
LLVRLNANANRKKKIRCDGGTPCPNCVEYKEECIYTPRRRRRKQNQILKDRMGTPNNAFPLPPITQEASFSDSFNATFVDHAIGSHMPMSSVPSNNYGSSPRNVNRASNPTQSYSPNDGSVTLVSATGYSSGEREDQVVPVLPATNEKGVSYSDTLQRSGSRAVFDDQEGSSIHSMVMVRWVFSLYFN